jgi:tetratricopeptide (TPR) repeat protein
MAKKRRFYKKTKPKEAVKELPSNSRIIPEKFVSDHLVFFIGFICILLAILIVSLDLYTNYKEQRQLAYQKVKVDQDLKFWQNEVKENPDYRDGYFSLALLYYQLKDIKNASRNLDKAMNIDPNFEQGKQLREILTNN